MDGDYAPGSDDDTSSENDILDEESSEELTYLCEPTDRWDALPALHNKDYSSGDDVSDESDEDESSEEYEGAVDVPVIEQQEEGPPEPQPCILTIDPLTIVNVMEEIISLKPELEEDLTADKIHGLIPAKHQALLTSGGFGTHLHHLCFVHLMLKSKVFLEGALVTRKLTKSGSKAELSFRLMQAHFFPWDNEYGGMQQIPFTGTAGLAGGPSAKLKEALPEHFTLRDIWEQYFPDDELQLLCDYTNRKVELLVANRPPYATIELVPIWPPSYLTRWKLVTLKEMRTYFILLLARRSLARGLSVNEFWSKNTLIDCSDLSKLMSRDRWCHINSCFTIYDPDTDTEGFLNPYWKANTYLERFTQRTRENYSLGLSVSRDEQCVLNNHRTNLRNLKMAKQYITTGIRMESITSVDGVVIDCMIDEPGVTHAEQTSRLIRRLIFQGHVVYMDRLYTSYKVLMAALSANTHICGTVSDNRGFPNEITFSAITPPLDIGEWRSRCRARICAYSWKDSAHCQIISSYHSPVEGVVLRRVRGHQGRQERTAPIAFVDFNLGMGGNDCGDMIRSQMSCHVKSKKWWKAIFCYSLDNSVIATFRIWNRLSEKKIGMRYTLNQLLLELIDERTPEERAMELGGPQYVRPGVGNIPKKKRRRYSATAPDPTRYVGTAHMPLKAEKKLACVNCLNNNNKRTQTKMYCSQCNFTLCLPCFAPFHSNT